MNKSFTQRFLDELSPLRRGVGHTQAALGDKSISRILIVTSTGEARQLRRDSPNDSMNIFMTVDMVLEGRLRGYSLPVVLDLDVVKYLAVRALDDIKDAHDKKTLHTPRNY